MKSNPGKLLPLLFTLACTTAILPAVAGEERGEFASALQARGWVVERTPAGDLIIQAPASATPDKKETPPPAPPPGAETVAGKDNLESLRERLEAAGWKTRRADDGSLLAFPAAAPAERPAGGPLSREELERLRQAGWKTEETADGSLLLFPPAPAQAEAAKTPAPDHDPLQKLQRQLEQAGWKTRRADDGSLLLFPAPASEPAARSLEGPLMDEAMQARLREAGWNIRKAPDGSLLLFPPHARKKEGPPPCPGTVTGAEVILPVNSWQKARRVAEAWLEAQPVEQASVGRIREVMRIYLVSIVSSSAPHRLRHQIAIRKRDGAVILLD